jgi:peptidoglycan/xylan/chitin deacetylase (PgdA/CDA1 family)/glycosyltransferase involved in cell wall biosynthesis
MYHSISNEPETGHPYYWINTSPARFAEHMKFLHDNNYQVISLSRAVEIIQSSAVSSASHMDNLQQALPPNIPSRHVVLTFDDGYRDFYTEAFRVLRRYGYTATVFLPTAYIDGKHPGLKGKEHLAWDEVRELYRAGISFGSHTVNHPQLRDLGWPEIEFELQESKAVIESQLSESSSLVDRFNLQPASRNLQPATDSACKLPNHPVLVDSFCYPYKFPEQDQAFVSAFGRLLKGTSYTCGTSTRLGSMNTNDDVFCLKRLPVNTADDFALFSAKLSGDYDWMSLPQYSLKQVDHLTKGYFRQSPNQLAGCLAQPVNQPTNPLLADQQPATRTSQLASSSNHPTTKSPVSPSPRYVIITPVKDEAEYIGYTIKSVMNQTIRPLQWIIVDDGSSDNTRSIVERYAREHVWMSCISGGDSGPRMPGVRHIRAFYQGYERLDSGTWDYIVKLDGDLSFDEEYFERCFAHFKENSRLGIGGGVILNVTENRLVLEEGPLFHVRGATKIYSRECWLAIGGLIVSGSYDTLDEIKANMMGFETRSFPDMQVTHHRYTGKAYGKWAHSFKNGLNDYVSGYHPLFMITKCVKRFLQRPYSVDALGLVFGYCSGYVKKVPQVADSKLIKYLRQQQLRRLTFRPSIWR